MNRQLWLMLLCGTVIVTISMGLRQSFGVFLSPVSLELGMGRQVFGLVIAAQALLFGVAQPVAGYLADRYGAIKAITAGAIVYALGLWLAGQASDAFDLFVSLGLLVGLGLTGATQVVVLGALGRAVSNERRSLVFGTIIASGSLGMFLFVPGVQMMLDSWGWREALGIVALVVLALPLIAIGLRAPAAGAHVGPHQSAGDAIREARSHRGYILLTLGFFVCGFHVTFVGTHLPAYLTDNGISTTAAAYSLGLIGLANVAGAYLFGMLGDRYSKKNLLVWIYLGRAGIMGAILLVPLTELTVLVFGVIMGILWLGTVPLTSGIVAQVFGTRYFSMLYGVVFMSHQLGSFVGAWLGGYIYDVNGSYDLMWMLSVLLGLVAALLHWPIEEAPLERVAA